MSVPLYETTANLLEELAKPLYLCAARAPENSRAAEECSERWYTLRSIARRIRSIKSIKLSEQNQADMNEALGLVHDLQHHSDFAGSPAIEDCSCIDACRIHALDRVLEEYKA